MPIVDNDLRQTLQSIGEVQSRANDNEAYFRAQERNPFSVLIIKMLAMGGAATLLGYGIKWVLENPETVNGTMDTLFGY